MKNSESDFAAGFGVALFIFSCAIIIFSLGYSMGRETGKSVGEKNTAIIMVQALNKIKQQLPKDTKIPSPFTKEQLNSLSYEAQDILKLF